VSAVDALPRIERVVKTLSHGRHIFGLHNAFTAAAKG
jgi:hypothetical protein